jgi:hypothetical protein
MQKQTFLEGWKTILTTITGAGSLAFADVPPHLLPYLTAIVLAAILVFGAQGVVKAWKGGK